ncbi:hypothetical protein C7H19_11540 [Aphanothece hegewaldii CCALA 016]|uniref:Uncharacterized protein n=1 Tax=Aphanothece hegewaldii CCALA 016 TaxID=2107694 RepID=A0A2T1LXI5_9CHRO|nr:hypothetical protein [Aphanothece hegewaldii]PSF37068.1 hypothetical protein C7H19_11540 [Aphanothece hegewaldii CCALA 016]
MATNKKKQKNDEATDVESKEEELLKDPNWVDKAIGRAKPIELTEYEKELANLLVELAYKNSESNSSPLGYSLAAAFDLFVAAGYYKNITPKEKKKKTSEEKKKTSEEKKMSEGWLYCSNPNASPLLIYPYTNTCPLCVLNGEFHFHPAKKPESGTIGSITQNSLGVFLTCLFERNNQRLEVRCGHRYDPMDIIIEDKQNNNIVLMGEVKAAPLTTLALAVQCDAQLGQNAEGKVVNHKPQSLENSFLAQSEFYLLLPQLEGSKWKPELISLGVKNNEPIEEWVYRQLFRVFSEDKKLFGRYFQFWEKAFVAYTRSEWIKDSDPDPVYWLTNGCGVPPNPESKNWPKREKGDSYKSVSDGKTSVGMDRTDDIKKGICQVLIIGASSAKLKSKRTVKTALLSNIHAVRHYDAYIKDLEDIVWTKTGNQIITKASQLPSDQDMYNLCDGIISFTKIYARDQWIIDNFKF